MDTLPIEDIARTFDVPVETLRSYAQRFALFVPAVRAGGEVRYPPDGVTLLGEIADAVRAGIDVDQIESDLQAYIPITVVSAPDSQSDGQPSPAPIEELRRLLDDQRQAVADQVAGLVAVLGRLATADQFHSLRAETASLAAALAQRDSHLEYTHALIVAELRVAFEALRQDIAALHAALQREREDAAEPTATVEPTPPALIPDPPQVRPAGPPQRRPSGRTPRRMGQPIRLNGTVQG